MPFYDSSELLPGGCALYADYVAIYFSELLCLEALVFCSRMVDFEQSCSGKDGFLCKSTAGRVAGSKFFFFPGKVFNLDIFLD